MKKVLIVGDTPQIGRTEEVYGRSFELAGLEVNYFLWREVDPSIISPSLKHKVAWRLAWKFLAQSLNQKLLETAKTFQPDLTFVISPNFIQPGTITALKKYGPAFVFFTDNPLDKHHTHSNSWTNQGLALWDAILIWSQALANQLQTKGISNVFYHAFCSDMEYHCPKKWVNSSVYDVAFIGNWDASRKREQYLKAISHYRLGIWGSDYWNTHCNETSLHGLCNGMCSYIEIPEILGASKIGLNILRPQNEAGHNIRTFEIPATGTLMLSERSQELLELFEEDQEAVYFSSPEELENKVRYLLKNPGLAVAIAKSGFEKATKHKIADRIDEIICIYRKIKSK